MNGWLHASRGCLPDGRIGATNTRLRRSSTAFI
jgi:hypothetical protein